ncbi:MAG: methyltransferase domain-containing protein [Ktedonobacteraceae bacterium]|nr:methyltransferase domain-containing protein [Ktedonobacteraceae bacterium]
MPENSWNASLYDQKHAFVFEYGKDVLALLAPQPGEMILDLGCGTGHLSKAIADAGAGVIGIDSSPAMIETARASYPTIEFHVADARAFSLPFSFDAVFSNATLHWVTEAEQVVQRVATALRPGGRFVAEFGGKGNCQAIIGALQQALYELTGITIPHGWYYPSIGEYAPLLEKHGLSVELAMLFDRPTRLQDGEQGLRNWLLMFCGRMLQEVSEEIREQAIKRTEMRLRDEYFREGSWFADYRRLRIAARKA